MTEGSGLWVPWGFLQTSRPFVENLRVDTVPGVAPSSYGGVPEGREGTPGARTHVVVFPFLFGRTRFTTRRRLS